MTCSRKGNPPTWLLHRHEPFRHIPWKFNTSTCVMGLLFGEENPQGLRTLSSILVGIFPPVLQGPLYQRPHPLSGHFEHPLWAACCSLAEIMILMLLFIYFANYLTRSPWLFLLFLHSQTCIEFEWWWVATLFPLKPLVFREHFAKMQGLSRTHIHATEAKPLKSVSVFNTVLSSLPITSEAR